MKRIISVTVLLTFLAASVFAVPVTNSVSSVTGENNLEEDLFSTVQAVSLTDLEMEAVEGEGWITGTLCLLASIACFSLFEVSPWYIVSGILFGNAAVLSYANPNIP